MNLKLGTPVMCTAKYVRRQRDAGGYGTKKYWVSQPITPCQGLYIGKRTLSNGTRVWMGREDGCEYTPDEYIQTYLVVFSARRRPVLIPIDSCFLIAQSAGAGEQSNAYTG